MEAMSHRDDRSPADHTRQFFTNWHESNAPVAEKLRLTVRNRFIAIGLLRGCCGHPGEPGC
jgi:hypothetical protein